MQLKTEAERRIRAIYAAYARGEDVAPAERYRVEGFLQAAVLTEALTEGEARALIDEIQQQLLTDSSALLEGEKQEGLELRSCMRRAPVQPS